MKLFYYILFLFWRLWSLLPFKLLYGISDLLYYPLYYCIRYHRDIVRKNLLESFPEKELKEIVSIEKGFYRYFGDYLMETVKLSSMSEKQMRKRMTFGGIEELNEVLEKQNCVVYMGHYCNWEWIISLPLHLAKTVTASQIYHQLENKTFDDLFLQIRARFGGVNIEMTHALRKLLQFEKDKKRFVIGFISDQAPNWNNINLWADFLHHDSAIFTGAERIARKVNAAAYYLEVSRVKRGYYHAEFVKMTDSPNECPNYSITTDYAYRLEQTIRKDPQYWLWTHNRWKRTHEEYLRRMQAEV